MRIKYWGLAALLAGGMTFTSCSDDDTTGDLGGNPGTETGGDVASYIIAGTVNSNGSQVADILTTESLTDGSITAVGNGYETDYASSATWLFFRDKYLYRLAYNQGQAGTTAAFGLDANGKIKARSSEYNITNFTAYGIYGNEIITSATGTTDKTDAAGNKAYGINFSIIDVENETVGTKTILSENFLGNGEYVMLGGLLEANGKIYSAVVPLGCSPYGVAAGAVLPGNEDLVAAESGGQGGGTYEAGTLSGTQYPNNCYVAIFDDDTFEKYTIVETDKMSWAAGRMRAAYYQMVWAADNGDIYVFSPSMAKLQSDPRQKTTHPSSIMRIKKGATTFDEAYGVFNIEEAAEAADGATSNAKVTETRREGGSGSGSGGHGGGNGSTVTDNSKAVYRSWHITGDYFLLQMYSQGLNNMGTGATRMAIFKGEDKTFKYVTGLPSEDKITSFPVKNPYTEDGICYIGVVTNDGQSPRVYAIDPVTATATPGLSVTIDEMGAIGRIVAQ